jgi:hypothetical protein
MRNNHSKHSRAPPHLDMFLMVERNDFKIVDVEMQAIIEWWGYYNCLQYYKIYGTVMKMFIVQSF